MSGPADRGRSAPGSPRRSSLAVSDMLANDQPLRRPPEYFDGAPPLPAVVASNKGTSSSAGANFASSSASYPRGYPHSPRRASPTTGATPTRPLPSPDAHARRRPYSPGGMQPPPQVANQPPPPYPIRGPNYPRHEEGARHRSEDVAVPFGPREREQLGGPPPGRDRRNSYSSSTNSFDPYAPPRDRDSREPREMRDPRDLHYRDRKDARARDDYYPPAHRAPPAHYEVYPPRREPAPAGPVAPPELTRPPPPPPAYPHGQPSPLREGPDPRPRSPPLQVEQQPRRFFTPAPAALQNVLRASPEYVDAYCQGYDDALAAVAAGIVTIDGAVYHRLVLWPSYSARSHVQRDLRVRHSVDGREQPSEPPRGSPRDVHRERIHDRDPRDVRPRDARDSRDDLRDPRDPRYRHDIHLDPRLPYDYPVYGHGIPPGHAPPYSMGYPHPDYHPGYGPPMGMHPGVPPQPGMYPGRGSVSAPTAPTPPMRHRQMISCHPCRSRKVKCSGGTPCEACIRIKRTSECEYEKTVRRRGKGKKATHGEGDWQEGRDDHDDGSESDSKRKDDDTRKDSIRSEKSDRSDRSDSGRHRDGHGAIERSPKRAKVDGSQSSGTLARSPRTEPSKPSSYAASAATSQG